MHPLNSKIPTLEKNTAMHKLLTAAFLAISVTAKAQKTDTPMTPPEASPFILKGYEALDYVAGDLNGDGKKDAILILKQPGEDTAMDLDNAPDRPLLVLIRQADGKLKQVARNDNAIMCRQCGGVFGDPYAGTTIAANGFILSFYGGSGWRWGNDYKFVYRSAKKNWYLVKENSTNYHAADPEHPTKNAVIEEAEFGETSLFSFKSAVEFDESEWKVTAVKTYFYSSPKLGSKPRKGYLLKGNKVSAIRQLKNFIEISFENDKGEFTEGYILRKDLVKQ